jgi:hypothetical protein
MYGENLAELRGKRIVGDLWVLKEQTTNGHQRLLLDIMNPKPAYNFIKPTHEIGVVQKKGADLRGGHRYFDSTPELWVAVAPAPATPFQVRQLLEKFAPAAERQLAHA